MILYVSYSNISIKLNPMSSMIKCGNEFLLDAADKGKTYIWCGVDENGVKRCPSGIPSNAQGNIPDMYIDPTVERCTRIDWCDSPGQRYSVFKDGSSDISQCFQCNCTSTKKCPYYVSSAFKQSGSVVTQIPSITRSPIDIGDGLDIYCELNIRDLINITPSISECSSGNYTECIRSNPCISGTMVVKNTGTSTGTVMCVSNSYLKSLNSENYNFDKGCADGTVITVSDDGVVCARVDLVN